jgi:hypothetical protein
MINKKSFTGIGARKTPDHILTLMTQISKKLDVDGWGLRSGGAIGADKAFEKGVDDYSQIFLPKKDDKKNGFFNRKKRSEAMYIISKYNLHENWDILLNSPSQSYTVSLHTRNVFQVLGENLDNPSSFLICWTPDGASTIKETTSRTGGTRTAIRLACHFNIPVFNLAKEEHLNRIVNWLNLDTKKKIVKRPRNRI